MNRKWLFSFVFLLVSSHCFAASYYIDFETGSDHQSGLSKQAPWKRHPFMKGFSGQYTHQEGDRFIFKGGVTWPAETLPLTIRASGGSSPLEDHYTVDRTWFVGSSWDYAVFDGGSISQYGIYCMSPQNNFVIEGIKILKVGSLIDGSGTGIILRASSNVEIRNCWFETYAINAFAYTMGTGLKARKVYFHNNHLRNNGRVHVFTGESTLDDFRFNDNHFEGPTDYDPKSFHCDGLMIGGDIKWSVTNLKIYNNKFFGDWAPGATALVYLNGNTQDVDIFNNVFAFDNKDSIVTFSPALLDISQTADRIRIYNNTFSSDAMYQGSFGAAKAIAMYPNSTNVDIRNNIFSRFENTIVGNDQSVTFTAVDYNLYFLRPNGHMLWDANGRYSTMVTMRARGYETNSIGIADPAFMALPTGVTGSGDWRLQSHSPGIEKAQNLSSLCGSLPELCFDIDGAVRPSDKPWDLGAHAFSSDAVQNPYIVVQPTSQTIKEGGAVTFLVKAIGTPSLMYQWFENGLAIQGATQASYAKSTVVYPTDNGKHYACRISNGTQHLMSQSAVLTVLPSDGGGEISIKRGTSFTNFNNVMNPAKGVPVRIGFYTDRSFANVKIVDRKGNIVKEWPIQQVIEGAGELEWDGRNESKDVVSSGVYTVLLEVNGTVFKKKIVLIK